MLPKKILRPVTLAGRVLVAILLLAASCCFAAEETPDELLRHADETKLVDYGRFETLLTQLDARAGDLSAGQRDFLDYLHAWQLGYVGRYADALLAFKKLIERVKDPTLLARARISLLNDQTNAAHYEDAYANLSVLLESLPHIQDHNAHRLILASAADLYGQAGQYDLALSYIEQVVAYDHTDRSICLAMLLKTEVQYWNGTLREDDPQIREAIGGCEHIENRLYANLMRSYLAQALIDKGLVEDALQMLGPHEAEMRDTHSSEANSEFHALLARCYLLTGDLNRARDDALSAINYGIKQAYSKSVTEAYEVLYEAAKQQGHYQNALDYHEKFAAANKGYLNDIKARALAYQMVHQEVLDKKREVDALAEKNKLLQMQNEVDAKTAENRLLYIALLFVGLCAIALWAVRVKRSEQKFQKLARRDGLTGIYNRQHFIELASDTLRYCEKSARDASMLVLDLDHFKQINDAHGHAAGDSALRRVVGVCHSRLRSIDIFGRLGGEEFAILLPDCTANTAEQRADEIRAAIASAENDADDIVVTASFGVAATHDGGYALAGLLAAADSALYTAKGGGRNRVATFRANAGVQRTSTA